MSKCECLHHFLTIGMYSTGLSVVKGINRREIYDWMEGTLNLRTLLILAVSSMALLFAAVFRD